jgi:transcriptional regulator with XRE-family HTH domain
MKKSPTAKNSHLRAVREAQGLTLAELARRTGHSKGYWSLVERGRVRPSIGALRKAGEVLGLRDLVKTLDMFWTGEGG